MKKFYYSKETSQDESPICYPMAQRNTMGVNSEQKLGMSTRAASVNSLDLMSETPTIPRVKTRDVTRSMSDVANNAQSQKHLVTETELSSSWLYKTMQASINARFKSPRKSPSMQKSELEQSILQDPELKPIPIKSKAAKTSSCICHFATMIAISLCTVGFLASIAAIIYMEIFADNRNITSLHIHTNEAEVDLSDVVLDSLEVHNLTTDKDDGEGHILNEALTHRFDGDEEILNEVLKASSTNDIPSLLNKNKSQEQFPDYVTDTDKLETSDFQQYIHKNSTIKFQDGVTVIYEMKSTESENDVDLDISDDFKGRRFGIDFDHTEENSSEGSFAKSPDTVVKENAKQVLGFHAESDKTMFIDLKILDNAEGTDSNILKENRLREDFKETVSEGEFKLKSELENIKLDTLEKNESTEQLPKDVLLPSVKLTSSEILQSQNIESEKFADLDANVLNSDRKNDLANKLETYSNDNTHMSKDSDIVLSNLSAVQTVQYEDNFLSTLKGDNTIMNDHDVNTMLVTIDDTEVSTDSFMSSRNDEINLFQVSSPVPSVEPVKQINSNASILPKKPVDIKGSLADAMKHLQKLDVNNTILTSRTKPKVNVQKPKRKTVSSNDERKRYLQRMRLMLSKQFQ